MGVVIKKLPHPYKLTHKITSKKREEAFSFGGGLSREGENNFFKISRVFFLEYFPLFLYFFLFFLPIFFLKMRGIYRGMMKIGG